MMHEPTIDGRTARTIVVIAWIAAAFVVGCAADQNAAGGEGDARNGVEAPGRLPDGSAGDGSADRDASRDAKDDTIAPSTWKMPSGPPDCDRTKPFDAGSKVAFPRVAVASVAFSPDELIALFPVVSGEAGIYQTTRATRTSPFTTPVRLPAVVHPHPLGTLHGVSVTADGLTLFLGAGAPGADVFRASRASTLDPFAAPTPFYSFAPSTVPPTRAYSPFVSPSGGELLFAAKYTGLYEMYRTKLAGTSIGEPQVQSALNLPVGSAFAADAAGPVLDFDELTLYFARPLDGGGTGIWSAKRPSTTAAFGPPELLAPVTVEKNERPFWISPDACRLYFQRGAGIWMATRGK